MNHLKEKDEFFINVLTVVGLTMVIGWLAEVIYKIIFNKIEIKQKKKRQ